MVLENWTSCLVLEYLKTGQEKVWDSVFEFPLYSTGVTHSLFVLCELPAPHPSKYTTTPIAYEITGADNYSQVLIGIQFIFFCYLFLALSYDCLLVS